VVIWGSGEDIGGGRRGHWLAKAASSLECPLWTVSSRSKNKKTLSKGEK
jgi:hypothetical protein